MRLVPRAPHLPEGPLLERLPARVSDVGGAPVRRLLPSSRRTVGAWCFLDHFGPHPVPPGEIGVPPHPHIGLQTVTWLLQGEMLHLDSLGSRQVIAPGQLNWMTAGKGVAHAEENRPDAGPVHGVQLWVALPEAARRTAPAFDHRPSVPRLRREGAEIALLTGDLCGVSSAARTFSPLLGAEITLAGDLTLPVDPGFEHGVALLQGEASAEGEALATGELLHLGVKRSELRLSSPRGAKLLLLGGAPFEEPLLMWWNFVARTDEEIRSAVDWWTREGPEVSGARQPPLPAPALAP